MKVGNVMGFFGECNGKRNAKNSTTARVCGEFFV